MDKETVIVALTSPGLPPGQISLRVFSLVLGGLQDLSDSIANTLYNQPSGKGKILQEILSVNHLVRKNAYFFAFFVLGVLVINAVRMSGKGGRGYGGFFVAFGICLLYAVSDEIHQLFVPGRGGQVLDVLIDGAGAVLGIGVYLLAFRLLKRLAK